MGVQPPHAIVVPFPVQGHINPMMLLAHNLASHGFIVTFINSQYNHHRIHGLAKSTDASLTSTGEEEETVGAGGKIRVRVIPDGLPEDDARTNFARLASEKTMGPLLHKVIDEINKREEHKVTCLIADFFASWALDVAQQCQINARAAFWPGLIATYSIIHHLPSLVAGEIIPSTVTCIPKEHKMIRYLSSMPALCSANLPGSIGSEEDQRSRFQFWLRSVGRFRQVEWILCNSFNELEGPIISTFPTEAGICPVGPLIPAPSTINGSHHAVKREKSKPLCLWAENHECLEWLDQQSLESVIYVSFGSTVRFNERQVEEVALGLEGTQRPFLWVMRPDLMESGQSNGAGLPWGFSERVTNQGCIISWAPQLAVLSHPSVGCFMSHCGWNSTVESIAMGVPMLCWPKAADQFLNSCYVVHVWKVGLSLFHSDGWDGIFVEKGKIESCVRTIMGGGHEGVEMRKRSRKLRESGRAALNTGGSSSANFHGFLSAMKRKGTLNIWSDHKSHQVDMKSCHHVIDTSVKSKLTRCGEADPSPLSVQWYSGGITPP